MYLELILLVLCINRQTLAASKSRKEALEQMLKNYDPEVYPNDPEETPTEVTVQLTITDIDKVNDQTEEFEMILYLRMGWQDTRLQFLYEPHIKFERIELTGDNTNKVWLPDLFFYAEREASSHGIMSPQKLVYIYQDGYIAFSKRITMKTECSMSFNEFPFDKQKCILHIESYAYTVKSLVLKWIPNDEAVQNLDTNTPLFTLTNIETTSGINTWSSFSIYKEMRNFSYLNATLTLERNTSVYWFLYFVMYPIYACMVVLSFGLKDTVTRVALCSTAILAVAVQWITVFATLPMIPHYTVIDKWILGHTIWILLAILYHTFLHLWISIDKGKRSRFNGESKISQPANEGLNQNEDTIVSSSTSTVSEWTATFKKEVTGTSTKITREKEMTIKRSFKDFRILDKYLESGVWSQCDTDELKEDFINQMMMKVLQPAQIEQIEETDKEKHKVLESFIADWKWKLPILFKIKEMITICWRCCGRCTKYCCCPKTCSRCCSCCKDEVVLLKHLPDGSVIRVKAEDNLINRSAEDFYYLQTYLQAKYPEFKWPRIPLHNVLTIADQRHLNKMREEYISDMVRLLQPNVWRHHSEIEKVMQEFIAKDEWQGSKWLSRYRIYIVSFVDSAGQKTGPDLFAFIAFLMGYSLFVTCLLHDKLDKLEILNFIYCALIILSAMIIIISVICAKYISMWPPTLWHANAKVERNTNRNMHQNDIEAEHRNDINVEHQNDIETENRNDIDVGHQNVIEIEHQNDIEVEHSTELASFNIATTKGTHKTMRKPMRSDDMTDKSLLLDNLSENENYQSIQLES